MGWVSQEHFEAVAAGLIITREKRREIQRMSREELQHWVAVVYKIAFEDGADAVQQMLEQRYEEAEAEAMPFEEVIVGWEDVLTVIGKVKGIGPKLLAEIDRKLKEEF